MCILACTACTTRNAACVSSPSNAACIAPRLAKVWWASVGELNLLTVGSHSLWRERSPPPEELTSAAGSARLSAFLAAGGAHPRSAALVRVLRPRAAGGAWPRGRRHSPAAQPSSHARLAPSRRRSMAVQLLDATRGACTRAAGRAASHAGGVRLRTTRRGRRCWLARGGTSPRRSSSSISSRSSPRCLPSELLPCCSSPAHCRSSPTRRWLPWNSIPPCVTWIRVEQTSI